jgi:hypothetical protein
MSLISRKWLSDQIIDNSKIDQSATFSFAQVSVGNRLGIGTTNPQDDLHIYDTSTAGLRLDNLNGLAGRAYQINSDPNGLMNIVDVTPPTPTTRLSLTSQGQLGVGTTNPKSDIHIYRSGSASISLESGVGGRRFQVNSDSSGKFNISDGTSNLTIDGTGSVGIGTTNPQDPFHLFSSNPSGTDLRIDNNVSNGQPWVIRSNTDGALYVYDQQSNQSVASFSKAFSPTVPGASKFYGDATIFGGLMVSGTTTINNVETIQSSALIINHVVPTTPALTIDTGYVGIGSTAPTVPLKVVENTSGPTIDIQQNGSGSAAIFNGGSVGIGTTLPAVKLHIYNSAGNDIQVTPATGITLNSTTSQTFNINDSTSTAVYGTNHITWGGASHLETFGDMYFKTGSPTLIERVRIQTGGNVGDRKSVV